MADILLINGPNLDQLGVREPELYGSVRLEQIEQTLDGLCKKAKRSFEAFHSNYEGAILEKIHQAKQSRCILINPGALTHTSIALRDAFSVHGVPFIEVHISNIFAREPFRSHSYLSDKALGVISGLGVYGYELALQAALQLLNKNNG